jgi:uncharacterized membrane protein
MRNVTIADFFREEEEAYLSQVGSRLAPPQNISQAERWASIGIGTAFVLAGLARGRLCGLLACVTGGAILHRGMSGHCYGYEVLGIDTAEHNESTAVPAHLGLKLEKTISVHRPADELFHFWRNFENLPRIMRHLKRVEVVSNNRSRWVAEGISGRTLEWDAEIINERENELIAWKSLPGGEVDTAGSVHFKSLPNGRGTAVTVSMKYNPPGGKLAATIAGWLGLGAEQMVVEDLRRFKQLMEAGEIPTTVGQPHG